jgi:hypothetical protein
VNGKKKRKRRGEKKREWIGETKKERETKKGESKEK